MGYMARWNHMHRMLEEHDSFPLTIKMRLHVAYFPETRTSVRNSPILG